MNTHGKYNGSAVIAIVGFVVVVCVLAIIAAPYFHLQTDANIPTIVISGMTALLGLLKSAQTSDTAGTDANPVKTEITNTPGNPVETHDAGTP